MNTLALIPRAGAAIALLLAAAAGPAPAAGADAPVSREEVLDTRPDARTPLFAELVGTNRLRRLASGFRFTEGPTWYARANCLIFSDIPTDTLYAWTATGGVRVWRQPSRNANGNTTDAAGNLITCEHGSRRVTRTESDGRVTVLAERFNGKRLNSPNDAAVDADGSIWFTDPPYGIKPAESEQPANYVFRLAPDGTLTAVATDFDRPNGICFAHAPPTLYVADSGRPHHVRRFAVRADGSLTGGEVFAVIDPGVPDGIRADAYGRLFVTAADGVWVFAPERELLGKILVPETPANCAFGGPELKTLFITARTGLYAITLHTRGKGGAR